jgi:hypothetical protein
MVNNFSSDEESLCEGGVMPFSPIRPANIALLGSLLSLVFIGACATPLTPRGAVVSITDRADAVAGCEYIGQINIYSRWGAWGVSGLSSDEATSRLKNKTGEVGADTVLQTFLSPDGATMIGEAYRCK